MPMDAGRCLANFKSLRPAPLTTNDPIAAAAYGDAMIQAIYQAWINELHANAAVSVVTNGSASTQSCNNGTIL